MSGTESIRPRQRANEIRVDKVRDDMDLRIGDSLGTQIDLETVRYDADAGGLPVDESLQRSKGPNHPFVLENPELDGDIGVDVLDIVNKGSITNPAKNEGYNPIG